MTLMLVREKTENVHVGYSGKGRLSLDVAVQCSYSDARHDGAARRSGEFVEREKRVERLCGGE